VNCNYRWRLPPECIRLCPNEVHVWRASLNLPNEYLSQLARNLSDDEVLRANHFHFEQDRRRFVAGRSVLRQILGGYLCVEPVQLQFGYGPHGKPFLSEEFDNGNIRFSIARSHDMALYAFTIGREIGADLEKTQSLAEAEKIVSRLFSMRENAVFYSLQTENRQDAFYFCWTRKEAYAKALGNGLIEPSGQASTCLIPEKSATKSLVVGNQAEFIHWSLETLVPAPGYMGALAVEGGEYHLNCYQWIPGYR
jgi:4'-phosphopantetheinyl transferase